MTNSAAQLDEITLSVMTTNKIKRNKFLRIAVLFKHLNNFLFFFLVEIKF